MPLSILFSYVAVLLILSAHPAEAWLQSMTNVSNIPSNTSFTVRVQGDMYAAIANVTASSFDVVLTSSKIRSSNASTKVTFVGSPPSVLIPLVGVSPAALCESLPFDTVSKYPCAVFGFNERATAGNWIGLLSNGGKKLLVNRSVPFACSEDLPCTIRTQDAQDGEFGGCVSMQASSDTLVVVTWNATRYLFRPLPFFNGVGTVFTVPDAGANWPSTTTPPLYDAGLMFVSLENQTSSTPLGAVNMNSSRTCALALVSASGFTTLFDADEDDQTTETGLRFVATLSPVNRSSESPLCLPSFQSLATPTALNGSLVSLTCADGEGWIWEVQRMSGGQQTNLVGHYRLNLGIYESHQPLIVDISVVNIGSQQCTSATGFLTTIAVIGAGWLEPLAKLPAAKSGITLSMAVFMALFNDDTESPAHLWFTDVQVGGVITVSEITVNGQVQQLRNGLGWVLPNNFPADADSVPVTTEGCSEVATEAMLWVASLASYSAATSNCLVLVNCSTGELVADSQASDGQVLMGGTYYDGPMWLANDTEAFIRYPTSALGTSALIQQRSGGNSPVLFLLTAASGSSLLVWTSTSGQGPWQWELIYNVFAPAAASLRYAMPTIVSAGPVHFVWVGELPLFYDRAQSQGDESSVAICVGAGLADMPNFASMSFQQGPPSAGKTVGILLYESTGTYYVCYGHVILEYTQGEGLLSEVWSLDVNTVSECSSGNCSCEKSVLGFAGEIYMVITFEDLICNDLGVLVYFTQTGGLLFSYASNQSSTWTAECDGSGTSGNIVDTSDYNNGFIVPLVGTSCLLVFSSPNGPGTWVLFAMVGDPIALSSVALVVSTSYASLLVSSSSPSTPGLYQILKYDLNLMISQINVFSMSTVLGGNPSYIIGPAISFLTVTDYVISLLLNQTTFDPVTGVATYFVEFRSSVVNSGEELWRTIPEKIVGVPLGILELFQVQEQGVCVAAGTLLCVGLTQKNPKVNRLSWISQAYGQPVGSINGLAIWATEGYPPVAYYTSSNMAGVGWVGLSFSNSESINQSRCSGQLIASGGLFISCSTIISSNRQLFIASSHSGEVLLAFGPSVAAGDLVISEDGQSVTYIDLDLGVIATQYFTTTQIPSSFGEAGVTVCSQGPFSSYVLTLRTGELIATMTGGYSSTIPQTVIVCNATYVASTMSALSPLLHVSFDSLISVTTTPEIVSILGPALDPVLEQLLTSDNLMFVSTSDPFYITDTTDIETQGILMSASSCYDCTLDCPFVCTLDVATGEQAMNTAHNQHIETVYKRNGEADFDLMNTTVEPIPYSGDVSINLARFQATLGRSIQPTGCYTGTSSVTKPVSTANYCLQLGGLYVASLANDGSSMLAKYAPIKSTSRSKARTYSQEFAMVSYLAWTKQVVLSVESEVGLMGFVNSNPNAFVGTSSGYHYNIVDSVIIGSDGRLTYGLTDIHRSVSTSVTYYDEECTSSETNFPLCRQTFRNFSRDMVDESVVTIIWEGQYGSNWGLGFVAADFEFHLPQILRSRDSVNPPIECTVEENTKQECASLCRPIATSCTSYYHYNFASYLYIQAWLPTHSSLTAAGPCFNFVPTKMEYGLKFYASTSGNAIATAKVEGLEVVVFDSAEYESYVFGVSFKFSSCVYYSLINIVAQPFPWLAIGAVKSLLLTFLFHVLEHRVRGRERRRDALKIKMSRLRAEADSIRDVRLSTVRERPPPIPAQDNPLATSTESTMTDDEQNCIPDVAINCSELDLIELEYARCLAEEQSISIGGLNPVDWFTRFAVARMAYNHPAEKPHQEGRVRANFLPQDLGLSSLADLLMFILKEDKRNTRIVKAFAMYYESNMCCDRCWVLRQTAQEDCGSEDISMLLKADLDKGHAMLREVYKIFKVGHLRGSNRTLDGVARHFSQSSPLLRATDNMTNPTLYTPIFETEGGANPEVEFFDAELFAESVVDFNALHTTNPTCFEYAVMSSRRLQEQLQPSALLLLLSLAQAIITILLYVIDVVIRGRHESLTYVQIYECIWFLTFNSSLPSTLLVNSFFHSDLDSNTHASTWREWLLLKMRSPFVIASLLLFSFPLATHVLPGLVLYGWALLPPFALVIIFERLLRRRDRRSSKLLILASVANRIAILLVVSIATSIAFNVADTYMWKGIKSEEPFPTGSYTRQSYLRALQQDYDSRSLACVWEHLFATISNFLQMGFFFV